MSQLFALLQVTAYGLLATQVILVVALIYAAVGGLVVDLASAALAALSGRPFVRTRPLLPPGATARLSSGLGLLGLGILLLWALAGDGVSPLEVPVLGMAVGSVLAGAVPMARSARRLVLRRRALRHRGREDARGPVQPGRWPRWRTIGSTVFALALAATVLLSLLYLGRVREEWQIVLLRYGNLDEQRDAAVRLGTPEPAFWWGLGRRPHRALEALAGAGQDEDPVLRSATANAVYWHALQCHWISERGDELDFLDEECSPLSTEAADLMLGTLRLLLDGPDVTARLQAAQTLVLLRQFTTDNHGDLFARAVESLTAVLQDPVSETRFTAARTLGKIGRGNPAAVAALIEATTDPTPDVRAAAVDAITRLECRTQECQSILDELSRDPDGYVRITALHAVTTLLEQVGPAPTLVRILENALVDPDPLIADALPYLIVGSIASIGTEDILLEVLRKAARGPGHGLVGEALRGERLESPEEFRPSLTRLISDRDLDVRLAAARAVDDADSALPVIVNALENGEARHKVRAAALLANAGADVGPAVPALAAALEDPDAEVRARAAYALGTLGPLAAPAIPDLRRGLEDPDPMVRKECANALGFLSE